jgi:hypothetical protein
MIRTCLGCGTWVGLACTGTAILFWWAGDHNVSGLLFWGFVTVLFGTLYAVTKPREPRF